MTDSLLDIWGMKRRAKRDSMRHSERIKKAIKENLKGLISDINIISSDGKKKTKIPIKFLDSYRFKYATDKNKEGVGQGNKGGKPGDVIAHDGNKKGKDKAGDQEGEEIYEEEIDTEEIIKMMLEDLDLPWLEKKEKEVEVETENIVFNDISEVGPLSNIDKRRTIFENMKRNAKKGKAEIAGIQRGDLRYRIWDVEREYHSNAAVYFLMDRSGSMDDEKKYIARAFYFWLANFIRSKYKKTEIVFIAHDTAAKIVPEENFFKITNSGGTMCSSAFKLAYENILENHPPSLFNNYIFEFSDGDNFGSDNKLCVEYVNKLLEVSNAVGYGEIAESVQTTNMAFTFSTLHNEFEKNIQHERFMSCVISNKEDIYACLKQFLGIKEK